MGVGNVRKNLAKIRRVIPEICLQTYKHTIDNNLIAC